MTTEEHLKARNISDSNLMLKVIVGSHAYGTNSTDSDIDLGGIYRQEDDGLLEVPDEFRESVYEGYSHDLCFYNLKKIILLLQQCNPNCTDLIFNQDRHILFQDERGELLRKNRGLFLSAEAKERYSGYALSQLKRMKNHDKWFNNPQTEIAPHIKNYVTLITSEGKIMKNFPDDFFNNLYAVKYNSHSYRLFGVCSNSRVKPGVFEKIPGALSSHDSSLMSNYIGNLIVDRSNYETAYWDWKNYWAWKKNRNPVRAELELKKGYDTKFAMHSIRLLKMGLEILRDGECNVYREDAKELLAIKEGKWTYEEILSQAEELHAKINEIYKSGKIKVPLTVDRVAINELYKKLIFMSK